MGDADYLHAFHKIVMPIAMEFAPEMVISAFPYPPLRLHGNRKKQFPLALMQPKVTILAVVWLRQVGTPT